MARPYSQAPVNAQTLAFPCWSSLGWPSFQSPPRRSMPTAAYMSATTLC